MTIEIQFGWWLIPAAITIAAMFYAAIRNAQENPHGNYGTYGVGAIFTLLAYGSAVIVSLIAWLIWSLAT